MKRAKRAKACEGKIKHATREAAQAHLTKLIKGGATAYNMSVYTCRHCGRWHVGHKRRYRGQL